MTATLASPRPVIRGESPRKQQVRVDWLNVTFKPNGITQDEVISQLSKIMGRPVSGLDEGKGIRGYTGSVTLFAHVGSRKKQMGFLGYGGEEQRGTWMLSISGVGCSLINAWRAVRRWLKRIKAKITRLDLCVD